MLVKTTECQSVDLAHLSKTGIQWQGPVYMVLKKPTQTAYGGEFHD
jgi:hypothetical protein